ncbi:MAG: hypothetical protein ACXW2C_00610 [Acidimicrobiia bacterium]
MRSSSHRRSQLAALNAIGGALTDRWGPDVALARALVIWRASLLAVATAPVLGAFAAAFTLATAAAASST